MDVTWPITLDNNGQNISIDYCLFISGAVDYKGQQSQIYFCKLITMIFPSSHLQAYFHFSKERFVFVPIRVRIIFLVIFHP